jgi:hypothetical protein
LLNSTCINNCIVTLFSYEAVSWIIHFCSYRPLILSLCQSCLTPTCLGKSLPLDIWVKGAKNIFLNFLCVTFLYWQMSSTFGRIQGLFRPRSLVLKIKFYTFARTAFIYLQMFFIFGTKFWVNASMSWVPIIEF